MKVSVEKRGTCIARHLAILRPKEEFANGEEEQLFSGQEILFDKQRVASEREFAELANQQRFLLNKDKLPKRELTNSSVAKEELTNGRVASKAAAKEERTYCRVASNVAAKEELTNGNGTCMVAAREELTNDSGACKVAAKDELTYGSRACKVAAKEKLNNGSGACKVAKEKLTNGRVALLKSQVVAAEKQLREKLDELADMEEEYTASQARGAPTAELADAYAVCMQEIHRLIEEVRMLYFLMLLDRAPTVSRISDQNRFGRFST